MPSLTIPTDAVELEEMLNDSARVQDIIRDGQFAEVVANYAKAHAKKDPDADQQIRDQVQLTLAEYLRDNGAVSAPVNLSPGNGMGSGKGAEHNRRAPGAAVDGLFGDPAEFFQSIWRHSDRLPGAADRAAKLDQLRQVQNSFSTTVPADGGFLVPENLRSQILQVALENAVVRPRATVIPMESMRLPIPMVDSTSNSSSVFGGVVCYWTEEGAALTESQASFGRVMLEAKKLTAYAEPTNELLAEPTGFMAWFGQNVPKAVAWYEDLAFLKGTGVGEPLGLLNAAATVTVAAEAGQATSTVLWQNIVKMFARMLPSSLGNAVWIVSQDVFPQLATMALEVGTGGSAVWLNNGVEGPPATILGRPVIISEKANRLGTAGDITFADLSYYLVGDRQTMTADQSEHYKFASDKTAFRIIQRVDGRPWLNSAITPQNNGDTLSPFVNLAARP